VNGRRVRTAKDLIERVFETYDETGATLTVIRNDITTYVVLQPIPELAPGDEYDWEQQIDSLPPTEDSLTEPDNR